MQTLKVMEETLESESKEVALYLAMSQKAEEEGHPDVALYLRQIAMDEAWHAAEFAYLLGRIKDTRSNLEIMLEDEVKTEKDKEEAAKVALSEGDETAFRIFTWSMHGERSHKEGLKRALSKLQENVKPKIANYESINYGTPKSNQEHRWQNGIYARDHEHDGRDEP